VVFLDLNGLVCDPDPPDIDDAEATMLAVAAHEVDEPWLADWLRGRVRASHYWPSWPAPQTMRGLHPGLQTTSPSER
jgi:hypothetical protein